MSLSEEDLIVRVAARGEGVTGDGVHVPLAAPGDRLLADGSIEHGPHHVEPPPMSRITTDSARGSASAAQPVTAR